MKIKHLIRLFKKKPKPEPEAERNMPTEPKPDAPGGSPWIKVSEKRNLPVQHDGHPFCLSDIHPEANALPFRYGNYSNAVIDNLKYANIDPARKNETKKKRKSKSKTKTNIKKDRLVG